MNKTKNKTKKQNARSATKVVKQDKGLRILSDDDIIMVTGSGGGLSNANVVDQV